MNHDSSQGMSKHMLIMLACCLIPIALIVAVTVFGFSLGSLTPFLPYALALMCPLMMIFMMRSMGHDHGEAHAHHDHASSPRPAAQITNAKPAAVGAGEKTSSGSQSQCH